MGLTASTDQATLLINVSTQGPTLKQFYIRQLPEDL